MQNTQQIETKESQNYEAFDYQIALDASFRIFNSSLYKNSEYWRDKLSLNLKSEYLEQSNTVARSSYQYMKISTDFTVGMIVIDIDRAVSDIIEALIYTNSNAPVPNLIVKNPKNKHVQLFYCLKNPVAISQDKKKKINYSQKAHDYYKAIRTHLTKVLDGDLSYHNYIAKNPYSTAWDTISMRTEAYTLTELAKISDYRAREYIELKRTRSKSKSLKICANLSTGHRNQGLFDLVRFQAYTLYNDKGQIWTQSQFSDCLFEHMKELNALKCEQPLAHGELRTICRSISNFCYTRYTGALKLTASHRQKLRELGRKGGRARSKTYIKARNKVQRLYRNTKDIKTIISKSSLKQSTVYKVIKKYKAQIKRNRQVIKPTAMKKFLRSYQVTLRFVEVRVPFSLVFIQPFFLFNRNHFKLPFP